jgi:rod shape-determining protein MreB
VGDPVSSDAVRFVEPFSHPRIIISNFACASKLLQYSIQQMSRIKWMLAAPILILQPDMDLLAGLSEIETRVLLEMGENAGARRTIAYYGALLTDREVLAMVNA